MQSRLSHEDVRKFTQTFHHDTYDAVDPSRHLVSKIFKGKVILITGASRGIGRAVAISFARAGASGIVICGRSEDDLQGTEDAILGISTRVNDNAEAGVEEEILKCMNNFEKINVHKSPPPSQPSSSTPKVLRVILDITDENSVSNALSLVNSIFGRLDVLVNNAGYYPTPTPIQFSEPSEWWRTFTTNVFGPYLITRSCLPLLISSDNGSKIVINVASWGAHNVTVGSSAYETSKLALLRLTEFIQTDCAPHQILSIAVHPGGILTNLSQKIPPEKRKFLIDTPELAGDSIVWLASKRREFLNGRYVSCNWDMSELEDRAEEIVAGDKLRVRMAT